MAKDNTISYNIPGMFGGQSEQAPALRLPHQVSQMDNAVTGLLDGTKRRPPVELIAELTGLTALPGTLSSSFCTELITNDNQKWLLYLSDSATTPLTIIKVLDGSQATISPPQSFTVGPTTYYASDYLKTSTPYSVFKTCSISDTTFILNTSIVAAMGSSTTTKGNLAGIVQVLRVAEGVSYNLNVTLGDVNQTVGLSASYTAIAGDTVGIVAEQLATDLGAAAAALGTYPLYTFWAVGPYVVINKGTGWTKPASGEVIKFEGNDSLDGAALKICNPKNLSGSAYDNFVLGASSYETLPTRLPSGSGMFWDASTPGGGTAAITGTSGLVFKIQGTSAEDLGYYVTWDADLSSWRETVCPGITHRLDHTTLPVMLKYESTNTFKVYFFGLGNPEARTVGDTLSNPDPSFITKNIEDVFFYKNRLGFLSGDSCILSVLDEPYNFFSGSAQDVLDTDPIDKQAASSTNVPSVLKDALVFKMTASEGVLINATGNQQFTLGQVGDVFSPKSVTLDSVSVLGLSTTCKPARIGPFAYYLEPNGSFSHIREYYMVPSSETKDGQQLTAHVPSIVPSGTRIMRADPSTRFLVIKGYDSTLSVHQYEQVLGQGGLQRVQNAFHRWSFSSFFAKHMALFDSNLYLICESAAGKVFLARMDLSGQRENIHLDLVKNSTGVYAAGTNQTTFPIPAGITSGARLISRVSRLELPASVVGGALVVDGDYSAITCCVGYPYSTQITLSEFVAKDRNGNPDSSVNAFYHGLEVVFRNTGYFEFLFTPRGSSRPVVRKTFHWFHLNADSLDAVTLKSSSSLPAPYRVPLMGNAAGMQIGIASDSHLPFTIDSLSYMMQLERKL